jgi:hypothetical protein
VTLTADLIGRTLFDTDRVVQVEQTFNYVYRTEPSVVRQTTQMTPASQPGISRWLLGSAGVKVNPAGRLLIVGNVLFSIGASGLQDELTPVIGIDYTF